MREQEYDTLGNPIYRHTEENNDSVVENSCKYLEVIEEHIEKHIGEIHMVFHEIVSEFTHIDVHWVQPTKERPYNILVTSGMSDKPMNLPDEIEDKENWELAEMMVILPADWKISQKDFEDNANYWPIYFLKMIARLPHQYNTWLGYGHTIPNGETAEPFADNTDLGCMLILPPLLSFEQEVLKLYTKDGKRISFYTLVPLYREEMSFKMEHGVDALLDLFDKNKIDDTIVIDRKNICL